MTGGRRARTAAVLGATLVGLAGVSGCGGGGTTTQPGRTASTGAPAAATATSAVSTPDGEPGVVDGSPGSGVTPDDGVTQVVTGTGGATGRGAPVPWDGARMPSPASLPKRPSGKASLTILLDDGFGIRTTWTLTCDPPGGTHPDPASACGVLGAKGATALPEPKGRACTEQYGGPQKAKVTGSWKGTKVAAQLSLENGCEIDRWTALLGLLPPGGLPG